MVFITIRLWTSGGTAADVIRVQTPVSSRSSFVAETQFQPGQAARI